MEKDFNFSKYIESYRVKGLVNPRHLIPKRHEEAARNEFMEIDQKQLQGHFVKILNDCREKIDEVVSEAYKKKIKYFKSVFNFDNDVRSEINSWRRSLIRIYMRDFYIYKKIVEEVGKSNLKKNESLQLISKQFINHVNEIDYYGDRLLFIHDFKDLITNGMKYEGLIKLLNGHQKVEFKTLFRNPTEYEEVIKKLVEHKTIKATSKNKFIWISISKESKLKEKKLICTLGAILKRKGYFNTTHKSKICKGLRIAFKVQFSDVYFGHVLEELESDIYCKNSEYVKYFHFLS